MTLLCDSSQLSLYVLVLLEIEYWILQMTILILIFFLKFSWPWFFFLTTAYHGYICLVCCSLLFLLNFVWFCFVYHSHIQKMVILAVLSTVQCIRICLLSQILWNSRLYTWDKIYPQNRYNELLSHLWKNKLRYRNKGKCSMCDIVASKVEVYIQLLLTFKCSTFPNITFLSFSWSSGIQMH